MCKLHIFEIAYSKTKKFRRWSLSALGYLTGSAGSLLLNQPWALPRAESCTPFRLSRMAETVAIPFGEIHDLAQFMAPASS
jgi:hypothetical protein